MDIYVEKETGKISLQEWIEYVKTDEKFVLEEVAEGIHPFTKQKLKSEIPGRAVMNDTEINYVNGRIGCEYASEEVLEKLKEIASQFGANVYDCGELIVPFI